VQVARECGYLDGLAPFLSVNSYGNIPGDRMVLLATGSQGEPRAAMMRIATEDHPEIKLDKGDLAIFSSRAIPGNEKNVNESINGLVDLGVTVLTDRDGLVHASGHPRRGEVAKLYEWIRPQIAIPAHGEPMHLATHAEFARGLGVPHVASVRNGDVMLLAPGEPGIIDQTPHGRVYKDGDVLIGADDESLHARKRLAFAGIVSVGLALTSKGELAGEADVVMAGLPAKSREGKPMDEIIDEAIFSAFDGLPRAKRRDADSVSVAIERAVRNTVRNAWGKRPTVHVLVMPV
jgi:ribonuclease J